MKESIAGKKEARISYQDVAPNALKGLIELDKYVQASNIGSKLYELVKMRASQINGCAYCLDMHSKDARAEGETEQRLYGLTAWREAPYYSDRERAALAWTEALTEISVNEVSSVLYKNVRKYFNEQEMIALTMLIIAINGWNRLAISFRTEAGSYKPELTK